MYLQYPTVHRLALAGARDQSAKAAQKDAQKKLAPKTSHEHHTEVFLILFLGGDSLDYDEFSGGIRRFGPLYEEVSSHTYMTWISTLF